MAVIHSQNAFMDSVNQFCHKITLSNEQFEAMSKQAERELRDNRPIYMFKVVALAVLGYAFIFGVAAFLVLIMILLIKAVIYSHSMHSAGGLKLLLLLLIPLYVIFKSFWITVPEPQGIVVTKKDAPLLFSLLDELSGKLNTRVDRVLLDDQYNAAVVQIPRLGMLGFDKNIVIMGLPLMLTQRPEQFKSVLAHELGHLSGNHSKSSVWIYKLRGRWSKLLSTIGEAGNLFFAVFLIFFSWFSPRFNAYSLALARAHELEADSNAAKIAGAENFTKSMLSLPVYSNFLGKTFWPAVKEEIKQTEAPPEGVFLRLQEQAAGHACNQAGVERAIKEAMAEEGSGGDTHPPLRVRLLQGYFEPVLKQDKDSQISPEMLADITRPILPQESAAYQYLGPLLPDVLKQLGQQWQTDITPLWQSEYVRIQSALEGLKKIEEKATEGALTAEEMKLKAYLIGETQNEEAGIAAYREVLAAYPDEPGTRFNLGVMLLKDDMEEGLKHLQTAVNARSTLIAEACPIIVPLLKSSGRHEEAAELESRLETYYKDAELAKKERKQVNGESILEPHGLQAEDLSYMQEVFTAIPSIKEAYVVRKFVRYLPDCPYLVIGLEMKAQSKGSAGVEENNSVAQWLIGNLQLPYEFCVSVFDMHTGKLKKNIVSMDHSLVYRK